MSHNFGFGLGVIAVSVVTTAVVFDQTIGKEPLNVAVPQPAITEPATSPVAQGTEPPLVVADAGTTASPAVPSESASTPPAAAEAPKPAPRTSRPPTAPTPPKPAPAPEPAPEPLSAPPAAVEPPPAAEPSAPTKEGKAEPDTTG